MCHTLATSTICLRIIHALILLHLLLGLHFNASQKEISEARQMQEATVETRLSAPLMVVVGFNAISEKARLVSV